MLVQNRFKQWKGNAVEEERLKKLREKNPYYGSTREAVAEAAVTGDALANGKGHTELEELLDSSGKKDSQDFSMWVGLNLERAPWHFAHVSRV